MAPRVKLTQFSLIIIATGRKANLKPEWLTSNNYFSSESLSKRKCFGKILEMLFHCSMLVLKKVKVSEKSSEFQRF